MFEIIVCIFVLAVIGGSCLWFYHEIVAPIFSWFGSNPILTVLAVIIILVGIIYYANVYANAQAKYDRFKD